VRVGQISRLLQSPADNQKAYGSVSPMTGTAECRYRRPDLPFAQGAAPPAAWPAMVYPPFGKSVHYEPGNVAVRVALTAGAPARKAAAVLQQLAKRGYLGHAWSSWD
jgi:hypothetical protein